MINFCDFQTIYRKSNYYIPKELTLKWFSGTGFGRKIPYTEEEKTRLIDDINTIGNQLIKTHRQSGPSEILMAVGAPGAGKTHLIKSLIQERAHSHYFVSRSRVDWLNDMKITYVLDLEKELQKPNCDPKEVRKRVYDKWYPAVNAVANLILACFISQKISLCFDTRALYGEYTPLLLNYFKERSYRIEIIHVIAPDAVRIAAIRKRDGFVDQDIEEESKLVPQRINDTYLKFADTLKFYYRDQINGDAIFVGTWNSKGRRGNLNIHNSKAYQAMIAVHNAICDQIGDRSLRWEKSFEKTTKKFRIW